MKPISQEERRLLIELAEVLPPLRDDVQQPLDADTRYHHAGLAIQAAQYRRWRALEASQDIRRTLTVWIGLTLAFISTLALGWLAWPMG